MYPMVKRKKQFHSARFDTSDIVQEGMLQVWIESCKENSETFDANSTYLKKVGTGQTTLQVRRATAQKRSVVNEERMADSSVLPDICPTPEELVVKDEQIIQMMHSVSMLPILQQQVVLRRYFDQMNLQDISAELEVSTDVVRTALKNALIHLRKLQNN